MPNSSLNDELTALKTREGTVTANKVANFAYEDSAYENDNANGVTAYDYNNPQNIPLGTAPIMQTNPTVLAKGFRSQASSIPRMLMNHFFGRVSYNLNKVNDVVYSLLDKFISFLGQPNGVATLDENGKIPYAQLPESSMVYKGTWNASTNTPALTNGMSGAVSGWFYICSVAGTVDFGAGNIQFFENDRAIYDGSVWSRLSAGDVKTVNNQTPANGNISITGNNIPVSAKDSTDIGNKILYQPRDLQAESRFNGDLYNQCILNGTYTADKYVSNDGTLADREGLGASDYLPVVAGSLYKCELTNNAQTFWSDAGCIYDSTYTKIATISSLASSSLDHVFVMPDNASYVRLTLGISSAWGSSTNFFKRLDALQINSVLKGKKIAVLGDSITYGFGLDNQEQRYTNVLARLSGATVLNYGVSGSKMSEIAGDTVASFVERVSQIDTSCDKVVIFGGTNDYWHNKTEIGFRRSSDTSTFCGAINYLITYLENHGFTNKDIVFIVPQIQNYGGSNSFEDRGGHFGTFLDFRNALMRTCGYRGVPVIDLFTSSGIDVVSNDSLISYYTSDGLHLNFRGQYIVAKAIFDFFQTTRYVSMGTTQADSVGIELFAPNSPVSTLDFSNGFYEEKSCFALNSAFNDSPSNVTQLLKTFIGNGANGTGSANYAFQILAELTGTSPDLWFKNSQSSWFKVAKRNGAIAGLDCLYASSANILPTVGTVTANYLPSTTPNAPTNTKNWWVLTFRHTESLAIQIACAGNDYACRYYSAGTWSSWTFMAQAVASNKTDTVKALHCSDEYDDNSHNEDIDSFLESGKTKTCSMLATDTTMFPATGWWTVISMGWYNTTSFGTQLIIGSDPSANNTNKMYYRTKHNGTWGAWQRVTTGDTNGFPEALHSPTLNSANTYPSAGGANVFFVPETAPGALNAQNTWILCWNNAGIPVQLACNGTITAVRYYYNNSWTEWNKQASASALGDQVTYSLSGTTLTITTK